jgi:hypothetical protein
MAAVVGAVEGEVAQGGELGLDPVEPWPDISTTIALRSLTGFFAVRVMRASFCPSIIDSGRTNTLGLRATFTSRTCGAGSLTRPVGEINYLVGSACRATSTCAANIR